MHIDMLSIFLNLPII